MKKYRIKPEMKLTVIIIMVLLLFAICIAFGTFDLLLNLIYLALAFTFIITLVILPIELILLLFKYEKMNKKILGHTTLICLFTFICAVGLIDKINTEPTTTTTTTTTDTITDTTTDTEPTTTTTDTIEESNNYEFDINDVEIEFTEKGNAIITNNSKYATTWIGFFYKENDCVLGTTYSLKSGDHETINATDYIRDGGYELVRIQVHYIDESGNEKYVEYDAVLDRYHSYS